MKKGALAVVGAVIWLSVTYLVVGYLINRNCYIPTRKAGFIGKMNIRILSFVILSLAIISCNKPKPSILLNAKEGEVRIEIDSVSFPEMGTFPIRVKLTNYSDKKVVLVFDTIDNVYKGQVRNLYLTADKDTFLIGVRNQKNYAIFNERTTTTFLAWGYVWHGEGHFDYFQDVEPAFKNGKLVYLFNEEFLQNVAIDEMLSHADTLLAPVKTESSTANAIMLDAFIIPSYEWREEKLKQPVREH